MNGACGYTVCLVILTFISSATIEVTDAQHGTALSTEVNPGVPRSTADLPDILLQGHIVIKIKTLSYIRELSYRENNLTRRLRALCEKEMAKMFDSVKGKQIVKVESFRRGPWSAVIVVMVFDSTGNGNTSEIHEIISKKIKDPGKFLSYNVDRRTAYFRPKGVFCQPRVHYAFESTSEQEVYDDSGFDNNGVIYGSIEMTRRGKCGKAGKFKNGYIYLRKFQNTKTSDTDAIVVTFWMKLVNPRSTTSLIRGYYRGGVIKVFMERGILKWKHITKQEATAFLVRHTKLLRARQWTHVVAVYDPYARKAKMYVDSELSQEVNVRKGMVHWRFTSSLRFGMTSSEGYLDDLYVYDCVLSEEVLDGIRRDCRCNELCAPRGKNEFLIRMILLSTNSSSKEAEQLANRVENGIEEMFKETSGEQRVQTIGHRPLDVDSIMVDYSLQSIGNSKTRYLAGVMQPAITAGNIGGVKLASNEVSFVPISGKSVCLSNEMKCDDGECINKLWKCDGEINCADGSDEVDCGEVIAFECQPNEFMCNRSRVFGISDCIDGKYRCDGQLDCNDDSDEQGCVPPRLITAPRSLLILAEGEIAVCTCVASGVPHPKISWYYKSFEVPSIRGKISVSSVAGHGKLTIFNVGQKDSGDYICKISDNRMKRTVAPSCTIRVRALGNVCRPPFFNSIAHRSDECLRCFCHERTRNCRSAQLYTSKLTSRWDCQSCAGQDEARLVDGYGKSVRLRHTSSTALLYWRLPSKYSGNRLTSYGGKLVFTFDSRFVQNGPTRLRRNVEHKMKYEPTVWNYISEVASNESWFSYTRPRTVNDVPRTRRNHPFVASGTASGPRALNLTGGHSVHIVGNDGTQLGSTNLDYLDDADQFGITITEENWQDMERSQTATRHTLLRVLTEVQNIFIKASSFRGIASRLLQVSLDAAVQEQNGGEKVSLVEQCACPVGYGGLSCEKCSLGYFRPLGSRTCVKCSCYNHSSTCDPVTGECEDCAHNTEGFNCEVCEPGYYGNATNGTSRDCKKCNCPLDVQTNTFSKLCYLDTDGKSTCTKCEKGYTGRNCELCAPGYEGNPTVVGGTCYKVGNFSRCNSAGSISQKITADGVVECACKANVTGSLCDKCPEGKFNLRTSNPLGCESCVCSSKSQTCRNLVGTTFTIEASILDDDFKLATLFSKTIVAHSVHELSGEKFLQNVFSGELIKRSLYWHLPAKFSGSKVASYGGYLEYTITYAWNGTKQPSKVYDVVLLGKRFGIIYVGRRLKSRKYENGRKQTYRVPLQETFWRFSTNNRVSKSVFVVFLGRIKELLILASPYVDMLETRLHEVKMDGAVENKTGVLLPGIERCSCPPAYTGLSCESCAMGYRSLGSSILGRCVRCNCHGHSPYCDQQTGVCQDCQHNTAGQFCEECEPGFYGKPKTGSTCQPCPCPRLSTNSATTCHMDKEGDVVCDRCPEGHEGKICDRCKESFTGNPKIPGEVCKPVSSCGCYLPGTERCDEKTNRCICKKNVQGEKCNSCKRGSYNLQEENDDGCTRCFCMGARTTCRTLDYTPETIKFSPQSSTLRRDLTIATEDLSRNISDFEVNLRSEHVRFLDKTWLAEPNVYWQIPRTFLGDKVLYYGGEISFSYNFHSLVENRGNNLTKFIKMKGNGQTLHYKEHTQVPSNTEKKIKIILLESRWKKGDGSAVSREEFMRILVYIDAILIPLSYAREATEARLGHITLVAARLKESAVKAELCDCPLNTAGSSCETCTAGYTRNGGQASRCLRCECNSRSTQCDPKTGFCQNCAENTAGKHCDVCARGFYGEARKGRKSNCQQCPCPLPGSSNRFSETCFLDKDGLPTCDACQEGYTGRRCQRCSLNYTGNPLTPGGKCFKVPVALIPKMKIIPEALTVQEGDSARFVCNVQSPRPTQILWSRRGATALPKRATVEGNVLSFTSLQISDRGVYLCTATNDIALRTAKASLIVNEQQLSAVIVDVSPKSRYIPVGATAKFYCSSKTSSRYSITWSRENKKPLPAGSHVEDGTLIISDAKIRDGGTYICTGKNALNVDRAIISLHVGVVVKPRVSVTPRRQIVDVADTVEFRCSASAGFPAPTLRWLRGEGRQLPHLSKFFSRSGIFKILAASRRDEGEYMCTASNSGGESVMRVQLLVKGPNSVPKVTMGSSRVTVDAGDRAVLRCDVSGDNPKEFQWSKLDGELPRTAVMNRNYLEIRRARIRDRGRYICTVTNRYGQDSAIASLFVNQDESKIPAVTIKPSRKVISIMEGKTLSLICEVAGDDEVDIEWRKSSKQGVLSQDFHLRLAKIKVEDTGIYECLAMTDRGEGRASVSVVVQRNDILPRVQARPSQIRTRSGVSVSFQCKASSSLPVSITWSRADGSPLNKNHVIKNTRILIPHVRKKDEGIYICVAENVFGASKATVELVVFKR